MGRGISGLCLAAMLWCGCGGGDGQGRITFDLILEGLPDLGRFRGTYEGWAVVAGQPRSTGKFIVDATYSPARVSSPDGVRVYGTVDRATFGPSYTGLGQDFPFIQEASAFFITVEPENDSDAAPSGNVIMAGGFLGKAAMLDAQGLTAAGGPGLGEFGGAAGSAVLANPTGAGDGDQNGIWFATDMSGSMSSLLLPVPTGTWTYEGWVSDGAQVLSTGKFRTPDSPDSDAQSAPTRGAEGIGFLVPGQDFVRAALVGAAAPVALTSGPWVVALTLEPDPDNSLAPFPFPLLGAEIPPEAVSAGGLGAQDVPLESLAAGLPALTVQVSAGPPALVFTGNGLPSLGPPTSGTYACWAVIGAGPVLVARFAVQEFTGQVTSPDGSVAYGVSSAFGLDPGNTGLGSAFPEVGLASELLISQEAQGVPLMAPSEAMVLSGPVIGGIAELTVATAVADFTEVAGTFVCLTPTDNLPGVPANDSMGLWFRELGNGSPSLVLPALSPRWRYQGWVVDLATGGWLSLGRFRDPAGADEDAMTWKGRGGAGTGFSVPGQDFVASDPGTPVAAGIDLTAGWSARITLEPSPDNDSGPFFLTVLEGPLPTSLPAAAQPLGNVSADFPRGRVEWE